ncbi:MAG: VCBS repeat-containing protein, partial [Nitrospiraceae bacterium]
MNLAADEVLNLNESFFVTQADVGEVNEQGNQSGAAITDGDFNGDGFVDLAVGSPGEGPDAGSGAASIFLGSEAGLTTGSFITQAAAGADDDEEDRFGAALFAGDFNGDGFEDLVVAAPGEAPDTDPRSGAVFIFPGSEEGITAGFMITQTAAG